MRSTIHGRLSIGPLTCGSGVLAPLAAAITTGASTRRPPSRSNVPVRMSPAPVRCAAAAELFRPPACRPRPAPRPPRGARRRDRPDAGVDAPDSRALVRSTSPIESASSTVSRTASPEGDDQQSLPGRASPGRDPGAPPPHRGRPRAADTPPPRPPSATTATAVPVESLRRPPAAGGAHSKPRKDRGAGSTGAAGSAGIARLIATVSGAGATPYSRRSRSSKALYASAAPAPSPDWMRSASSLRTPRLVVGREFHRPPGPARREGRCTRRFRLPAQRPGTLGGPATNIRAASLQPFLEPDGLGHVQSRCQIPAEEVEGHAPPAGGGGLLEFRDIGPELSWIEADLLVATIQQDPIAQLPPEVKERLPERVSRAGRIELGPEHRQQGVASEECAGTLRRQTEEEGQPLRLGRGSPAALRLDRGDRCCRRT